MTSRLGTGKSLTIFYSVLVNVNLGKEQSTDSTHKNIQSTLNSLPSEVVRDKVQSGGPLLFWASTERRILAPPPPPKVERPTPPPLPLSS